jgi:hypothetical protein
LNEGILQHPTLTLLHLEMQEQIKAYILDTQQIQHFRFGQWNNDLDIITYTGYVSNEPLHYWSFTESSTSGRYIFDKTNNTITSDATKTTLLSSSSGNFTIGSRQYGSPINYYSGEILRGPGVHKVPL